MSKLEQMSKALNLPLDNENNKHKRELTPFPDDNKQSLIHNKKELLELYRDAKNLFGVLIDDAINTSTARDIEVLGQFMEKTANLLKAIKEIDEKLEKDNNDEKNNPQNMTQNNIIVGNNRELLEFIDKIKKKIK